MSIPTARWKIEPTILVADNAAGYRKSLCALLTSEGYLVEEAESVKTALQKLGSVPACLSLVDLRLTDDNDEHDTSGLEVANKSGELKIPSIVITAYNTPEAVRKSLAPRKIKYPPADLIPKIDGPQAILDVVKQIIPVIVLHISDLHLTTVDGEAPYEQSHSLNEFQKDLVSLARMQRLCPIQAIVVSGDLSHQCRPAAFDAAYLFLASLCDILGVSHDHVVLVPGNHDIERHPNASSDKYGRYTEFLKRFYAAASQTMNDARNIYPIDDHITIVALDSCAREADPKYKCPVCPDAHYYGWIKLDQVRKIGEVLDERQKQNKRDTLRIVVCHHHVIDENEEQEAEKRIGFANSQFGRVAVRTLSSISRYVPSRHVARKIRQIACWQDHLRFHTTRLNHLLSENNFRILLHGHAHKRTMRQPSEPRNNRLYRFGSGTLWLPDTDQGWESTYLLLYLSPLKGYSKVIMRKYHPSTNQRPGYWGPDDYIEPDGIVFLENVAIPRLLSQFQNQEE